MTPTERLLRLILKGMVILLRQHYVFGGNEPSKAQELIELMEAELESEAK
jgi:hypothetical protein